MKGNNLGNRIMRKGKEVVKEETGLRYTFKKTSSCCLSH